MLNAFFRVCFHLVISNEKRIFGLKRDGWTHFFGVFWGMSNHENQAENFQQQLFEYRTALQDSSRRMQSEYDKAIMALSGGALGISLTFLKDIVLAKGVHNGFALLTAWSCWGARVTCSQRSCSMAMSRFIIGSKDARARWTKAVQPTGIKRTIGSFIQNWPVD